MQPHLLHWLSWGASPVWLPTILFLPNLAVYDNIPGSSWWKHLLVVSIIVFLILVFGPCILTSLFGLVSSGLKAIHLPKVQTLGIYQGPLNEPPWSSSGCQSWQWLSSVERDQNGLCSFGKAARVPSSEGCVLQKAKLGRNLRGRQRGLGPQGNQCQDEKASKLCLKVHLKIKSQCPDVWTSPRD